MWSDRTELPANRPSDRTVNVGPHYQTWQHWFPLHTHTHWEDSESWASDLTWQQRLLLSLTSDPFLPVVASSSAPPCPSLSHRTNVIEEALFGQAVAHFLSTHTRHEHVYSRAHVHTHVILVKRSGVDVNGHVATEAGREGRSICVGHVSRAPPVPAHHVSDSTDLLVQQASVCGGVVGGVC